MSAPDCADRYSDIALANDSLLEFRQKFPKAKLRIICISDGEDNMKGHLVHNLAANLARDNVVVDSICLGMYYLLFFYIMDETAFGHAFFSSISQVVS
jgi:hypothetical protein